MHVKKYITAGADLGKGKKVLIMLHGRGADARDILGLAQYFKLDDFTLIAPEAVGNTWYPYSFLSPVVQNEPWLSSAINMIGEVVKDVEAAGVSKDSIYFLGFSQGACLTLEYTTRNATKYGGVIAFTGGLIGAEIKDSNYTGDFAGTKVFIGTSDPDPHVPVARVNESAILLENKGAIVTKKVYKNLGHTINEDEIEQVNKLFFSTVSSVA